MLNNPKNEILVFLDSDNIEMNARSISLEKMVSIRIEDIESTSIPSGYEKFKNWLSSFGEIVCSFAFAPRDKMSIDVKSFYEQGFIPICCPVLPDKMVLEQEEKRDLELFIREGKEAEFDPHSPSPVINTTDELMIKTAIKLIPKMPSITHVCIASGDGDFYPIVKIAKHHGKKVMIMVANQRSASKFLLSQADKGPDGKRMIHYFDPRTG